MEWYLKVVKENYANFNGRARRKEYWMFTLINTLIIFGLAIFVGLLADTNAVYFPAIILGLYVLGVFIPNLAVTVRRFHDTGKSGWYYLLSLIPYVGGLILIIMMAQNGDTGTNQYGPDPKAPDNDEINEIGKPILD
ncbi:MAG: hypothetical protein CMC05_05610 [Flavobacteriaceae bacterium]|nr:hypothetical protein [Flavobacteriaceae bacterium]MBD09205.1 hypothetical protein [Flavobacteriaceae bacterium]|tara:strand:+ start:3068 stop:3478 length:411 start_codon:yes stop_codon:yes gene_type:complete